MVYFHSRDPFPIFTLVDSLTFSGHELPYAIRMNHIRALHEYTHDENDNHYEQSGVLDDDGKLQFILKKAKKGNTRNNLGK